MRRFFRCHTKTVGQRPSASRRRKRRSDRRLWVGSASSRPSDAAVRLRIFRDRRSARADDRSGPGQLSPRHGRRSSSEVDRSFEQETMTDSIGSIPQVQAMGKRPVARRGPHRRSPATAVPRTAAIRASVVVGSNDCFAAPSCLEPRTPQGRQRQFAIIGGSRSAPNFSRSSVGTRERPLWPWPTFSAAWAKVKFRGRPVVRAESHDGQQWVDCGSSMAAHERLNQIIKLTPRKRACCAGLPWPESCLHRSLVRRQAHRSALTKWRGPSAGASAQPAIAIGPHCRPTKRPRHSRQA